MKSNSSVSNKRTTNTNQGITNNKIFLVPLIFIASILPFIMHSYQYDTGLGQFPWFSDDEKLDIFLFYKQIYLIICCVIMLVFISYNIARKKIKLSILPIFIPIFIYGFLALISTIFSKYPGYGVSGIYEQFESIFVLLGYCLIIYYAYLFVKSESDVQVIMKYLLYSVLAFAIIGLLQALALDPIVSEMGKKLYMGREYWDYLDGYTLTFDLHRVYLTLYNPNYVGSYTALLIPLLFGLFALEKETKKKVLYFIGFIGLMISLIFSNSKTGLIAVFVSFIFFLFFFRKYIFKNKKIALCLFGICVVGVTALTFINYSKVSDLMNNIFKIQKVTPNLTNIQTGEELIFTYKGEHFKVSIENDNNNIGFMIADSNNNPIPYDINDDGSFLLNNGVLAGITVSPLIYDNKICVDVKIDNKEWIFTNQLGDNTYYYLNSIGKFDKIISADSALFTGYESVATSRGYIWSRTIPLLKDHILLGSGADSYIYTFPQQDYVNLYNSGFDGQVLTRPHNLYLQMGVQTGVISLIAFLVFYIMYFINCVSIYRNGIFNSFKHVVGVSIFLGTIGYMITGISNDSTITVAPVFWVLLGTGIAINHMIKQNQKQNSN